MIAALLVAWTFIKQYKTLFLWGVLFLFVGTSVLYYGHTRYEAGKKVGDEIAAKANLALLNEQKVHRIDVAAWKAAVEAVDAYNKSEVARKDAIIKKNKEAYDAKVKRLNKEINARPATIQSAFKPSDVVTAPSNFRLLYNGAVGSYSSDNKTESIGTNPFVLTGEVDTFGATPFAEVMVKNVDKYNALALKCDALIDIVKEEENAKATNHQ